MRTDTHVYDIVVNLTSDAIEEAYRQSREQLFVSDRDGAFSSPNFLSVSRIVALCWAAFDADSVARRVVTGHYSDYRLFADAVGKCGTLNDVALDDVAARIEQHVGFLKQCWAEERDRGIKRHGQLKTVNNVGV